MRARIAHISRIFISVFVTAALIIGCKKEPAPAVEAPHSPDAAPVAGFAPGFPAVSGYFYCDVAQDILPDSSDYEWRISGLGVFSEPADKLDYELNSEKDIEYISVSGNLHVGEVTLNEYPLAFNDYSKFYKGRPRQPMSPDTSIRWRVQGYMDQALIDDAFAQPFPKFNSGKSLNPVLRKSQDYKLEVSDYFFNYDSIWMTVPNLALAKMKPGTSFLQFDARHVKYAYPSGHDSVRAQLKASKYYYAKHAGRYYQYVFVAKFPISIVFTNQ